MIILLEAIVSLFYAFCVSFVGMLCWNNALVYLFNVPYITFWKMFAVFVFIVLVAGAFRVTNPIE